MEKVLIEKPTDISVEPTSKAPCKVCRHNDISRYSFIGPSLKRFILCGACASLISKQFLNYIKSDV